jgi:hypothetical protein
LRFSRPAKTGHFGAKCVAEPYQSRGCRGQPLPPQLDVKIS